MESDQAMTTEQAARSGQVLVKNLRVACIELADTLCDEADETSSDGHLGKVVSALSFARNINTLFGELHRLTVKLQANAPCAPNAQLSALMQHDNYERIIAALAHCDERGLIAKQSTHGLTARPMYLNRAALLSTMPIPNVQQQFSALDRAVHTCFNDLRNRGKISHLAFSMTTDLPETTVNGYKPLLVNILLEPISGSMHVREFAIVFQALLLTGMQQVDQRQTLTVDLINILGPHESFYDADDHLLFHVESHWSVFRKLTCILCGQALAFAPDSSGGRSDAFPPRSSPLERILQVLDAYHSLFISSCSVCSQVLREGVPPLMLRLHRGYPHATQISGGSGAQYTFKHDTCTSIVQR